MRTSFHQSPSRILGWNNKTKLVLAFLELLWKKLIKKCFLLVQSKNKSVAATVLSILKISKDTEI